MQQVLEDPEVNELELKLYAALVVTLKTIGHAKYYQAQEAKNVPEAERVRNESDLETEARGQIYDISDKIFLLERRLKRMKSLSEDNVKFNVEAIIQEREKEVDALTRLGATQTEVEEIKKAGRA